MGEGPPTEVTGHLLLDPRSVAVSLSLVALQGALVGQFLGALWALLLALLGHGTAFHMG